MAELDGPRLEPRSGVLKYEFRVRPGARPSGIRLAYAGARGLSLDASGALVTPGLVDIHTHVRSAEMPAICLSQGVTSLVDAGSRGADTRNPRTSRPRRTICSMSSTSTRNVDRVRVIAAVTPGRSRPITVIITVCGGSDMASKR